MTKKDQYLYAREISLLSHPSLPSFLKDRIREELNKIEEKVSYDELVNLKEIIPELVYISEPWTIRLVSLLKEIEIKNNQPRE